MSDLSATISIALQSTEEIERQQQWIQLCPAGKFAGRDGRGPWFALDLERIIQDSTAYAGRTLIPIDYDHQIDRAAQNGKPAIAAGWITSMQARESGIWARVEWTERAAQLLSNKEYRYLSPVFTHQKNGQVKRIIRAALTNNPNLTEMTALASAETYPMDRDFQSFIADVKQVLSLTEDADLPAILAAVKQNSTSNATNSSVYDPSRYVPVADFEAVTAELNSVRQGVSRKNAETHVDRQIEAGNLFPYLRDWGVALCSVNKPAFDAFVAKTRPNITLFQPVDYGRSSFGGTDELSGTEHTVCLNMGISPEEYRASQAFTEGHLK